MNTLLLPTNKLNLSKRVSPLILGSQPKKPQNIRRFTGIDYRVSGTKIISYDLPLHEQVEDPSPQQERELLEKCVRRLNKKYNMSLTPDDFKETKEEQFSKETFLPGVTAPFNNSMDVEDKAYVKDVMGIDVDKDVNTAPKNAESKESEERKSFLETRAAQLEANPDEHKAVAEKQAIKIKESTIKGNKLQKQHNSNPASLGQTMDVIT